MADHELERDVADEEPGDADAVPEFPVFEGEVPRDQGDAGEDGPHGA